MKKILLIDDNHLIRVTTSLLLKQHGYEVILAASGADGLRLAQETRPDLILLDIMMPVMDGWQVLASLQDQAEQVPPVIVFSAMEDPLAAAKAQAMNAKGFLRKPFKLNEILAIIRKFESTNE